MRQAPSKVGLVLDEGNINSVRKFNAIYEDME